MPAGTSSLDAIAEAFAARVQELQELVLLRGVDVASDDGHMQELNVLDAHVQAAEQQLRQVQAFIQREKQAIVRAQALHEACSLQHEQLHYIGSHLPARLPELSQHLAAQHLTVPQPAAVQQHTEQDTDQDENCDASNQQPAVAKTAAAADKKKKARAPRRYVSQSELASLSGYMRGRLTIETVNAALDEAASHGEANSKLMAAVRANTVKAADRKRGTTLLHCVAGKEGIRGKHWFLETDLKSGTVLKVDKTGKAILTVLRHLGRLSEIRVSLDGDPQIAHVLQAE